MSNAKPTGAKDVRTPWGGPQSKSDLPQLKKAAAILFAVLNPVAAVLWAVFAFVFTRPVIVRRPRAWVLFVVPFVALVVAVVMGQVPRYLMPWRDSFHTFADAIPEGGVLRAKEVNPLGAVGSMWADRWAEFVAAQVPLGAALGASLAGYAALRRARYRAHWRDESDDAAQAWKDAPKVAKRAAKLDTKPAPKARTFTRATKASASTPFRDLAMPLGLDVDGRRVEVTGAHLMSHVVVTGPSGYGKSNTLARLLRGWLVEWKAQKFPAVVLDFKGDPELANAARAYARASGRQCHVVTLDGATTYAPLRRGSSEEVASRLMNVLENGQGGGFSEPHYRVLGQRMLLAAMTVLDAASAAKVPREGGRVWRRELGDVAALMNVAKLADVARESGDERALKAAASMSAENESDKEFSRAIGGLRQRVALLDETGAGAILSDLAGALDVETAVKAGDVIVFSLAAEVNAAAARDVGNLAVADLASMFGRFNQTKWSRTTGKHVLVVLDEFSALGGELLLDVFARARSAGGRVVLSSQTGEDFAAVSDQFAASVNTNSNVWLLHRQVGDAAEAAAKAIGTRDAWQETKQITEDADALGGITAGSGVGTLRRVKGFKIHPDELKELAPGQVIMWSGTPPEVRRVIVSQVAELKHDDEQPEPVAVERETPEPVAATTTSDPEASTPKVSTIKAAPEAKANPFTQAAASTKRSDESAADGPDAGDEYAAAWGEDDDTADAFH